MRNMSRVYKSIIVKSRPLRRAFQKFSIVRVIRRVRITLRYLFKRNWLALKWATKKTEESNFYYDLTQRNINYLVNLISHVTGKKIDEIESDEDLKNHLVQGLRTGGYSKQIKVKYARRVAWYSFVRAIKPKLVIETGVDHGVGSCVLAAALIRNTDEGYPGRHMGTEINPEAGFLFDGPYSKVGEIVYQDSIVTLGGIKESIDLFINDSDHSSEYELREYETISRILSSNSIILGDNSHASQSLMEFSRANERDFVFFREEPKDHWYPGAGIGISYVNKRID